MAARVKPGAWKWRPAAEGALLLLILALAAWLRLKGGAANPGWFSDEGAHLSIAHNLLLGRDQYLAVGGPLNLGGSTLLFSRLPAFEWLLAGALALAGAGPGGDPARGMAALRALTGALGVVTVAMVYAAARESDAPAQPRTLPLLAALIAALYPAAVLYSRFGFSYNLLAPLGLGMFWALGRYVAAGGRRDESARRGATGRRGDPAGPNATERRGESARRWLLLGAALAGLCTLVEVWAWVWLPALAGAVALRWWGGRGRARRSAAFDLLLAALAAGAPFTLYALRQWLAAPEAFLFDVRFVLGRLNALSLGQQAAALWENAAVLATQEGWLALGLLALFALRPARRRALALLLTLLPLALLGRTTALHSLGFYYLIPLLPWAGVGLAALAARVAGMANRNEWGARVAAYMVWVVAAAALGSALWTNARGMREGFVTAIDPFLLDAGAARAAADFLAERRSPDELALASPALAWLLPGQAADFQMALAYAGQATPHIPADLPHGRYAFDPSLDRARYVVVDNLWRNWGVVHAPGLEALLREVEQWPAVFRAGEIVVYQRP